MSHSAGRCLAYGAIGVLALSATQGCIHIEREVTPTAITPDFFAPSKNRTSPDAIAWVQHDPEVPGTGLFVIPAPDVGPMAYSVRMVPDLTYRECVQRGQHCRVYKFVPYPLVDPRDATPEEVIGWGGGCGGSCVAGATNCVFPCACPVDACVPPRLRDIRDFMERLRGIDPLGPAPDTDPPPWLLE